MSKKDLDLVEIEMTPKNYRPTKDEAAIAILESIVEEQKEKIENLKEALKIIVNSDSYRLSQAVAKHALEESEDTNNN